MTTPAVKTPNQPDVAGDNAPVFNIQRIYLKGTSLEMPHAPEVFLSPAELTMDLNVTPKQTELAPGIYEVTLHSTVTAKDQSTDKVFFLLEVQQAGIFEFRNIPAEHVEGLLAVRCPEILHNYLRVQVTDILSRATLPSFIMPEINWHYVAEQAKAASASAPRTIH